MASSFLYFLAFSSLRRRVEARSGRQIGVTTNLAIAMLAGCCNVLVTEPLDTLSTRRQICGADDDGGRRSGSSARLAKTFFGAARAAGAGEDGKGAVSAIQKRLSKPSPTSSRPRSTARRWRRTSGRACTAAWARPCCSP